jgi:iron(III) transport system permease protein
MNKLESVAERRPTARGEAADGPSPVPFVLNATSGRKLATYSGRILVLLCTAAFVAVPVVMLVLQPFKDDLDGLRRLVSTPTLGKTLLTTVGLGLGSTAIALVVGTALAWFARDLPPGRRWMGSIPLGPLLLPQAALVTGFLLLMSPTSGFLNVGLRTLPGVGSDGSGPLDIFQVQWIVIVLGVTLAAFVYVFVRGALANLSEDVLDAARVCGASPFAVFRRVALPLLRPALINSALTVALIALGQFTAVLLLGRQQGIEVLSTQIYRVINQYPSDFALATAYGLPLIVVGVILLTMPRLLLGDSRRFVANTGRGGAPGSTRSSRTGPVLLLGYGLVTTLLPVAALVVVSFQEVWQPGLESANLTLGNYRDIITGDTTSGDAFSAILNSAFFATVAVVLTVPLAYAVARIIHNRRSNPALGVVQDVVAGLPLGVPAVILGTGFLLTFTETPLQLYGKPAALVLVYVVLGLPLAVRAQLSAMASLSEDLLDAAGTCGASPLRRTLRIQIPLLRPALAGAAALVFILASHEFTVSLLIRSIRTNVMGNVLYDFWYQGDYPHAAVMAVVMCVLTSIGVGLALVSGGTGAFRQAAPG